MKFSSLSVKRRPVKKGAMRKLFANIPRKKVRAATAAAPMSDVEGDVPNLGIARALVVILIIHVVAIAGIFAHSHFFEGPEQKAAIAAKQEAIIPVKPLPDAQAQLPKVNDDGSNHIVSAGDTYGNIAIKHGVEEKDLRAANDNIELRAGRILRVPPRSIVAVEPEEMKLLRQGSVVLEMPADELRDAPMVETAAASQNSAVLVRPGVRPVDATPEPVRHEVTPPKAVAVQEKPASRSYTVKSGDTFWKIAQAHGTTPNAVMKANKISDPKKLKIGMQLVVP